MKKTILAALALIALTGCGDDKAEQARRAQQERAADQEFEREIERGLSRIDPPREYQVGTNQLLVLHVPVKGSFFLEHQRCFVWRDVEFKTTSMQCEEPPEMADGSY